MDNKRLREKVKNKIRGKNSYDSYSKTSPMSLTVLAKETLVVAMKKSGEDSIILQDLLGNFSDQTGATFG